MGTGSQQAPTIVVPIGTVVQRDSFGSRMLDGGCFAMSISRTKRVHQPFIPNAGRCFRDGTFAIKVRAVVGRDQAHGGATVLARRRSANSRNRR